MSKSVGDIVFDLERPISRSPQAGARAGDGRDGPPLGGNDGPPSRATHTDAGSVNQGRSGRDVLLVCGGPAIDFSQLARRPWRAPPCRSKNSSGKTRSWGHLETIKGALQALRVRPKRNEHPSRQKAQLTRARYGKRRADLTQSEIRHAAHARRADRLCHCGQHVSRGLPRGHGLDPLEDAGQRCPVRCRWA
jgi:hypothetical protein